MMLWIQEDCVIVVLRIPLFPCAACVDTLPCALCSIPLCYAA